MTVVACLEAVSIVIIIVAFLRHLQGVERDARSERSELLTRIQHPERVVVQPREYVIPEVDPDADQLDLIGTIADPPAGEQ